VPEKGVEPDIDIAPNELGVELLVNPKMLGLTLVSLSIDMPLVEKFSKIAVTFFIV
jgi:hypothetical protein